MFDVDRIIQLHSELTSRWHSEPFADLMDGYLGLVCQQHRFNFELWHQEDIARSPDVRSDEIARVKRTIDQLNQARNDHVEKLDDWLTEQLERSGVRPTKGARLNTETPGSAIDRLSILSLRVYHYQEELNRSDTDADHRKRVGQRLSLCGEQQSDLAQSLKELLLDIQGGVYRHRTYRQLKMYNDPNLNPYLYQAANKESWTG